MTSIVLLVRGGVCATAKDLANFLGDEAQVHVLGDQADLGPKAVQSGPRVRYALADTQRPGWTT